jgi:tRNA/rRNA methyltransferase
VSREENLTVVLVEPRNPGNVGSVARVMANTGFSRLSLVRPCPLEHPELRMMALDALPLVREARVHDTLAEALHGVQTAVATTCRGGRLRREPLPPRAAAATIWPALVANRTALVFGPEDRGLDNDELSLCHLVASVPTHQGFPSLNLSHAVLVFLWELRSLSLAGEGGTAAAVRQLASVETLEGMYGHLEDSLTAIGFLQPENPERIMRVLRRVLNRAALDPREARVLRGLARQLDWYVTRDRRG